jgi:DNA-binding NarL/FixJ family response regulator
MNAPRIRVLLAEDHHVVREGLRLLVNTQPDMEVVGEASNGQEAWERTVALRPNVVVMDLSMPGMGGLQATEILKTKCPDAQVLALTVHEDESYLRQSLQARASGYLLKRAAGEELIRAIRVLAAGGQYLDPGLTGRVLGAGAGLPTAGGAPRAHGLSQRERTVLGLIAWGYTNKEIALQLNISVKTVETYRVRLTEKLKLRSRAEIVRYALRQGWLNETHLPPSLRL